MSVGLFQGVQLVQGNLLRDNGGDGMRTRAEGDGGSSNQIVGNVIRDNSGDGLYVELSSPTIRDNQILNSGGSGLVLQPAFGAGHPTVTGNVINGNARNGLSCQQADATIQGNQITNNGLDGIQTTAGGQREAMDQITGNTIAYSGRDGIWVSYATRVTIQGNSIHDNGNLGIELTDGANGGEPAPTLDSATLTDAGTVITGTLTGTPDTTFTLEFFANDSLDASGNGEGQTWLGGAAVTTDDTGQATFTVTVAAALPDQIITATATDPLGNTSAFSAWIPVTTDFPWRHQDDGV